MLILRRFLFWNLYIKFSTSCMLVLLWLGFQTLWSFQLLWILHTFLEKFVFELTKIIVINKKQRKGLNRNKYAASLRVSYLILFQFRSRNDILQPFTIHITALLVHVRARPLELARRTKHNTFANLPVPSFKFLWAFLCRITWSFS